MRTLYFDIDGVLLDYEDHPRPLLKNGSLQEKLEERGFGRLVCVSGWSDSFNVGYPKMSYVDQKKSICRLVGATFDPAWLMSRLELAYDTDNRCRAIDVGSDWYYMDDWADEFFTREYGAEWYLENLGSRVLLVNPYGDGSDILTWIERIVVEKTSSTT